MANVLPFQLLVDKVRHRSALRLSTLPPTHPLYNPIQNAATCLVKRHRTPLHDLMHSFRIHPRKIETINATRYNTKWKPDTTIKIIDNADDATADMEQDHPDVKIFTDGSSMDNKIGAAAALYRNGRLKSTLRYKLGSQKHHTVYEGEGVGMLLGTKLMEREWGIRSANFYIDNRAVILATRLTKPAPGSQDIKELTVMNKQMKKAITDGSSDANLLPRYLRNPLPHSKSAQLQAFNEKLKVEAQKAWQKSPRYTRMKITDPSAPSNKFLKLTAQLPRTLTSILTQLQTGHAPLAKHLHRIKKTDSPMCPACLQGTETVQHFMLHCPAH
jgi:hypothetical protein